MINLKKIVFFLIFVQISHIFPSVDIQWSLYSKFDVDNYGGSCCFYETSQNDILVVGKFVENENYYSTIAKHTKTGNFIWQLKITGERAISPEYIYENNNGVYVHIAKCGPLFSRLHKSLISSDGTLLESFIDINSDSASSNPNYGILPGLNEGDCSVVIRERGANAYYAGFKIFNDSAIYQETKIIDSASYDEYSNLVFARKAKTSDNSYIVLGYFEREDDGKKEWYIYKINSDYKLVYKSPVPATEKDPSALFIDEQEDGNVIIAGRYNRESRVLWEPMDTTWAFIKKLSPDGTVLWENLYGIDAYTQIIDLVKTKDGGYLAVGHNRDYYNRENYNYYKYMLKTDSDGNVVFETRLDTVQNSALKIIRETDEGDFLVFGYATEDKYYLARIDGGTVLSVENEKPDLMKSVDVFPNPASGYIDVKINSMEFPGAYNYIIYNPLGRKMAEGKAPGANSLRLELTGYSPGVYYLHLTDGSRRVIEKFIVE